VVERKKMKATVSYKIKGIVIFGIVITTKKQLEQCPISITVNEE